MSEYNFLVPEMAHDVIEAPTFFWVTRCLDVLCAIILLVLLFYHVYVLYTNNYLSQQPTNQRAVSKSTKSNNNKLEPPSSRNRSTSRGSGARGRTYESRKIQKWSITLHILTICYMIFSFITLFILLLNIWSAFPSSYECDIIIYILCSSFHLSKSSFYAILIARLQVAFGVSAYAYKPYQIYSLFIAIMIYSLFILFGTPFIVYGKWLLEPDVLSDWCHVHIIAGFEESIGVLLWITMDMIISIVLLYLFQKPLKRLLKNMKKNEKLSILMIKYTILTWISVILSIVSFLLYLWRHITILIEISAPITCICVVLMHSHYEKIFNILCGNCIKCILNCSSHDTQNDAVNQHKELKNDGSNNSKLHIPQESDNVELTMTSGITPDDSNNQSLTPITN